MLRPAQSEVHSSSTLVPPGAFTPAPTTATGARAAIRANLPVVIELVLTVGVLGFVGFRLASAAGHSFTAAGRSTTGPIVLGIRWRHVWPAPFVVGAVLVVATRAAAGARC